jgi:hypothetical protein
VFEQGALKDSVSGIRDLRGTIVALRGDTILLNVDNGVAPANAGQSPTGDRRATLALDQSTTVTLSEVDGWMFAYALLAGAVLVFAALVMSGS